MKTRITILSVTAIALLSFTYESFTKPSFHLNGTWRLVAGSTTAKGVSTPTEYPKNQEMIKIINDTHFAFLNHWVNMPKDSSNHFDAGGGSYTLNGDQYTEHLDYYSDRNWENKAFNFTITMHGDTLIQNGIEKVENEKIDRVVIEKYIKVK